MNIKIILYLILGTLIVSSSILQQMGQEFIVHAGICLVFIGLILSLFYKTLTEDNKKPVIKGLPEMNPTYVLICGIIIFFGGILYIWHGLE